MEFWFVLGHDPLEVAFLLPSESLCKVVGRSELVWLSFGLEINFYFLKSARAYQTYPVGISDMSGSQTFEFGDEIWYRPT